MRRMAVRAVVEKHPSPEGIAEIFGIRCRRRDEGWRGSREGGENAWDTPSAPGALPVLLPHRDRWLKPTLLNSTPADQGEDTGLWTLKRLVDGLQPRLGLGGSDSTVALH